MLRTRPVRALNLFMTTCKGPIWCLDISAFNAGTSSLLAGRIQLPRKSSIRRSPEKSNKSVRFSDDIPDDLAAQLQNDGDSRSQQIEQSDANELSENSVQRGFIQPPKCQALQELFWTLQAFQSLNTPRRKSAKEKDILDRLVQKNLFLIFLTFLSE